MNPAADFGEIGMGLLRSVRPWDEWIAGWGFDKDAGEPDLSTDASPSRSAPWWATRTCSRGSRGRPPGT